MKGWTELGPGVRISETETADGGLAGWTIEHETEPGVWCAGWVPRIPGQNGNHRGWDTSTGSVDGGDLTLLSSVNSQSVQCHTHKDFHGHVRDGKWEPV